MSDFLSNAPLSDLKKDYTVEDKQYSCLFCTYTTTEGHVYPYRDIWLDARARIEQHMYDDHHSVFTSLLALNKKFTGLTEHQSALLTLFYEGKTDQEIQQQLEIGSAATIRHHRFSLKEKERQARIFLTLMELLKEKDTNAPTFIPVHTTATMMDERYNMTEEEAKKLLKKWFKNGKLLGFSMQEKHKIVILRELMKGFAPEQTYSEREVNDILKQSFDDFVTLRRYLIEYGFLDRENDGTKYWVKGAKRG